MERLVGISDAAKSLGVSVTTLRRWEVSGKLVPEHTAGGHRRYDLAKLRPEWFRTSDESARKTVAYARVSRRLGNKSKILMAKEGTSVKDMTILAWKLTIIQ